MADYPISNVPRRVQYVNTGVGPYLFNFEILTQTDIAVYRGNTLLTLTTDYTVSINSNGTGSVTLTTAGTGNITIVGARAIQRSSDYTTNGDLFASTLNTDLDSQTIYSQQLAETLDRTIKVPVTDASTLNMQLPGSSTRSNKVFAFDASGRPQVSVNTLAAIDSAVDTIESISGSSPGSSASVSHIAAGSGAVATTAQAKLREFVSVKDFGAVGNGVTDDSAAIQAAHDYIVGTAKQGTLYFPAGTYKCNSALTIQCSWVSCVGQRAKLDFSSLGDVAAITFKAGGNLTSGNPWNQATFVFEGFILMGPNSTTGTAMYLNELTVGSNGGPAHTMFKDFQITNFKTGIYFGNHTYLCFFDHFDIWNVTTGIWFPTNDLEGNAIIDSGENISFYNGTIFGTSLYDVYCQDPLSRSDMTFTACSFDGSGDAQIYNVSTVINLIGCHFEGTADRAIVNSTTSGIMTLINGFMIDGGDLGLPGYIDNSGYLSVYGGRITSERPQILRSNSGSRLACFGCHFQTAQTGTNIINALGNHNYWLPNQNVQVTNGSFTSPTLISPQVGFGALVTLSTVNVWVNLGVSTSSGVYVFRDNTSGGTAVFAADSSAGAVSIQNGITGFEMRYDGTAGDMQIRVTSGTLPRLISRTLLKTNA